MTGAVSVAALMFEGEVVLAVAESDGAVRLLDDDSRDVLCILQGHSKPVTAITGAPPSGLITSSEDGTVRVWTGGGKLWSCSQLISSRGPVLCTFALSQTLASLTAHGSLKRMPTTSPSAKDCIFFCRRSPRL